MKKLEVFADSSFHQLWYPRTRWAFGVYATSLESAGGLTDKPKDRRLYRDYLEWLTAADGEQKRFGFAKMTRGWAKGSQEFKKTVLEDIKNKKLLAVKEREAVELREVVWARSLLACLTVLEKTVDDIVASRKGADRKVALACYLRECHLVPHKWLTLQVFVPCLAANTEVGTQLGYRIGFFPWHNCHLCVTDVLVLTVTYLFVLYQYDFYFHSAIVAILGSNSAIDFL